MKGTGKETALITGASSGIGLELARLMAEAGFDLVLVSRGKARLDDIAADLEQAHGIATTVLPADLARPGAAGSLFDRVDARELQIDVLINNAGFGSNGPFHEIDAANEIDMVNVNVTTLVELTRLFLPGMVQRGHGRILNVGSLAGFQPDPFMATYGATKAFVRSFSEALSKELEGTGVTVTALCPGPVHTGFSERARMRPSSISVRGIVLDAPAVAKIGYHAMMKGKRVVTPGVMGRLHGAAIRLLPRRTMLNIVASINRKRRVAEP